MVRGREQFQKYKRCINLISSYYNRFPKRYQLRKFNNIRYKSGKIAMAIRYALLKNLCKSIGDNVSIHENVYIRNPEELSVGNNVSIWPLSYIDCKGGINIGDNVSIAHGVSIVSFNHGYRRNNIPIKDQDVVIMPITIHNNVWIGAKATILGNVELRDGCIVGAGAVVTKSVERDSIVAGVPAKLVKMRLE